jgi:hypothetical protein
VGLEVPHQRVAELLELRDFALDSLPEEEVVVSLLKLFPGELLEEGSDVGLGLLQDQP